MASEVFTPPPPPPPSGGINEEFLLFPLVLLPLLPETYTKVPTNEAGYIPAAPEVDVPPLPFD
jgi:hypothetical protein